MRPPDIQRPLPHERARTIEDLCTHFVRDHLEMDEFESRLDLAHRAETREELGELLRDLPALPADVTSETGASRALAAPGEVGERGVVLAVLSGTARKGAWVPPRRLTVVASMGGAELDFREARLGPGVTKVFAFAFMGGVDVVVPPGLAVVSRGTAIMGGFDMLDQPASPGDPDAPVLDISGLAVWGGIEVTQRLPGESARDTRRRLRAEKKKARRIRNRRE